MVSNRFLSLPLWTLILFLLLLVIGVGERWITGARERGPYPPEGVSWIWSDQAKTNPPKPVSFLTYRDFSLKDLPEAAEIIATADEELRLFLNGNLVIITRNPPGEIDQVRRVDITQLLRMGANRLSAELRSSRGVGGFFLCLRVEDRCLETSDSQWVTLSEWNPGVHRGWWPAGAGEPVRRWFAAPVGRWDFVLPQETSASWVGCKEGEPIEGQRLKRLEPVEGAPFSRQVYDFGSEVRGIIRLRGSEKGDGFNLLRVESSLQGLAEWKVENVRPVVTLPGQRDWSSAEILEGRYVELTGFPVKSAVIQPAAKFCGPQLSPSTPRVSTLDRGRSMAPIENEIRRRLEGLPSRTTGEGI